ncbi:MAG: hypothetical protein ACYDEQ_10290, partial [Desulfocucumaceae bacterium]
LAESGLNLGDIGVNSWSDINRMVSGSHARVYIGKGANGQEIVIKEFDLSAFPDDLRERLRDRINERYSSVSVSGLPMARVENIHFDVQSGKLIITQEKVQTLSSVIIRLMAEGKVSEAQQWIEKAVQFGQIIAGRGYSLNSATPSNIINNLGIEGGQIVLLDAGILNLVPHNDTAAIWAGRIAQDLEDFSDKAGLDRMALQSSAAPSVLNGFEKFSATPTTVLSHPAAEEVVSGLRKRHKDLRGVELVEDGGVAHYEWGISDDGRLILKYNPAIFDPEAKVFKAMMNQAFDKRDANKFSAARALDLLQGLRGVNIPTGISSIDILIQWVNGGMPMPSHLSWVTDNIVSLTGLPDYRLRTDLPLTPLGTITGAFGLINTRLDDIRKAAAVPQPVEQAKRLQQMKERAEKAKKSMLTLWTSAAFKGQFEAAKYRAAKINDLAKMPYLLTDLTMQEIFDNVGNALSRELRFAQQTGEFRAFLEKRINKLFEKTKKTILKMQAGKLNDAQLAQLKNLKLEDLLAVAARITGQPIATVRDLIRVRAVLPEELYHEGFAETMSDTLEICIDARLLDQGDGNAATAIKQDILAHEMTHVLAHLIGAMFKIPTGLAIGDSSNEDVVDKIAGTKRSRLGEHLYLKLGRIKGMDLQSAATNAVPGYTTTGTNGPGNGMGPGSPSINQGPDEHPVGINPDAYDIYEDGGYQVAKPKEEASSPASSAAAQPFGQKQIGLAVRALEAMIPGAAITRSNVNLTLRPKKNVVLPVVKMIDLSYSHAPIMRQLGLAVPGRMYRGVKD